MLNAPQLKAARALLNWTQKDLSIRSGISLNAINNFERDLVTPRQATLAVLQETFELSGLEFIGATGVNKVEEQFAMEKYEGAGYIARIVEDMELAFKAGHRSAYFHGIVEDQYSDQEMEIVSERWWDLVHEYRIDERVLLKSSEHDFLTMRPIYRWVSDQVFGKVPHIIYGDTMAITLWGPPVRAIFIRNAAIAETFRQHFLFHWEHARAPTYEQQLKGWQRHTRGGKDRRSLEKQINTKPEKPPQN